MTTHKSRRAVLAFAMLLVASTTLGAPLALAASPVHAPIAKHAVRPYAQVHALVRAITPHSVAGQSDERVDDPFASLHFE